MKDSLFHHSLEPTEAVFADLNNVTFELQSSTGVIRIYGMFIIACNEIPGREHKYF